MIGSTGEDVLIRQGGLSSTGFSYFLLLGGEISPVSEDREGHLHHLTYSLTHIRLDWSQDSFIIFPPSFSSSVMHHFNVIVIKCELTVIM